MLSWGEGGGEFNARGGNNGKLPQGYPPALNSSGSSLPFVLFKCIPRFLFKTFYFVLDYS